GQRARHVVPEERPDAERQAVERRRRLRLSRRVHPGLRELLQRVRPRGYLRALHHRQLRRPVRRLPRRRVPMSLLRKTPLGGGLVSTALACTAIVSEDATQCATDGDCAARGPDFVDTVCGANGFCQEKPAAPPECTKNSDCKSKGEALVCCAPQQK